MVGILHVLIRDFGHHHSEFVDVINDDMSRRFVLRPFNNTSVSDVATSDKHLYCIGGVYSKTSEPRYYAIISVFDLDTGKEKRKRTIPLPADGLTSLSTITYLDRNDLLVAQSNIGTVFFIDPDTLEILWQTDPLFAPKLKQTWWFGWGVTAKNYRKISSDTRPPPAGSVRVKGRLFEDVDGKIWGLSSITSGSRQNDHILGASTGLFSFDLHKKTQNFYPVEFSAWKLESLEYPSPDGRMVVRRSPQWELGPRFKAEHLSDDYIWFIDRRKLDVWSVNNQKPISRIRESDTPVKLYVREVKDEEVKIRNLADWTKSSNDRFRQPFLRPPNTKSLHDYGWCLRDLNGLRKYQSIKIHWESDSKAFWIVNNHSLQRVDLDGNRGPMLFFDCFLNDDHRAILDKRPDGVEIGYGEVRPLSNLPLIRSIQTNENDVEIICSEGVIKFAKSIATSNEATLLLTDDITSEFKGLS